MGVPKVLCAGVKLNFYIFFFIGVSAIKSGLPEDFLKRGKKTTEGGSTGPPTMPLRVKTKKTIFAASLKTICAIPNQNNVPSP